MESPANQLAVLIRARRKELNIRQEDLASLTNVALRTLRDMEGGKGNPSLETIRHVMEILGLELQFNLKK